MSDLINELSKLNGPILIWPAFLLGLVTSAHCISMCGPIVFSTKTKPSETIFYNVGRLLGYLFLVFLASKFGDIFRVQKENPYLASVPIIFLGLLFIYIGIKNKKSIKLTKNLEEKVQKLYFGIFNKRNLSNNSKKGLLGLLTIFLPCGLLYTMVLTTIGFSNASSGLYAIVGFWLGTLPAMSFAPYLINIIIKPIYNKIPNLTSWTFVSIGSLTIIYRMWDLYEKTYSCH